MANKDITVFVVWSAGKRCSRFLHWEKHFWMSWKEKELFRVSFIEHEKIGKQVNSSFQIGGQEWPMIGEVWLAHTSVTSLRRAYAVTSFTAATNCVMRRNVQHAQFHTKENMRWCELDPTDSQGPVHTECESTFEQIWVKTLWPCLFAVWTLVPM